MAKTTFTRGPITVITRNAAGFYPNGYCRVINSVTAAQNRVLNLTDPLTSRTLVKGDHVHAAAYTGKFIETIPLTGVATSICKTWDNQPGSQGVTLCGPGPSSETVFSQPVAYLGLQNRLTGPPIPPAGMMATLTGIANTKANADLRRSLINAPLLLAERRQTAEMLVTYAKRLSAVVNKTQRESLLRYYKAAFKDRRRVSKEIANEHLMTLFGLLPLLDEIQGVVDIYQQPEIKTLTGRGRMASETLAREDKSMYPQGYSAATAAYASCFHAIRETVTRFSVRTSVSVDVTLSPAQFARDLGFNPLAATYDLVPLSFLTDFISNLGSFIRALDPLIGVSFRTGSTTSWIETRETVQFVGSKVSIPGILPTTLETSGKSTGFQRALVVNRIPLSGFPDNELHFVNTMTVGKAITGLSLAVQRFVKPLRAIIRVKQFRYKGHRPKYLPPINYR